MAFKVRRIESDKDIDNLRRGEIVELYIGGKLKAENYLLLTAAYNGKYRGKMMFFGLFGENEERAFQIDLKKKDLVACVDGRLDILQSVDYELDLKFIAQKNKKYDKISRVIRLAKQ